MTSAPRTRCSTKRERSERSASAMKPRSAKFSTSRSRAEPESSCAVSSSVSRSSRRSNVVSARGSSSVISTAKAATPSRMRMRVRAGLSRTRR